MRDLKFRVWNPNANKFVAYSGVNEMPLHEAGALILKVPVYEVLQYTGLKDRHGVEIYEGDIINDRDATWYVEFGNGQYVLRCTCHYPDGDFYVFEDSPTYEVIGNIYENPELLEEKP